MSSFNRTLPMMLNYTLDNVMPVYRELFAQYDLTDQQWRILRVLWSETSINSADLSKRTLLPAPSLVGILDRLEKKGLVQRVRSDTDRRSVYIQATDKGHTFSKEILPKVEVIQSHVEGLVTAKEWQVLESTLNQIKTKMNNASLNTILQSKLHEIGAEE